MADPYIGEIRLVGFNFAPRGWATCEGQLLPIAQYQALFSLLGTTYGGDGRVTFGLPDLRSRIPVGRGPEHQLGQQGGAETVTLTGLQIPSHTHVPSASDQAGNQPGPAAAAVPARTREPTYAPNGVPTFMAEGSVGFAGGGQPHENMSPFLGLVFVIATQGLFPPRN